MERKLQVPVPSPSMPIISKAKDELEPKMDAECVDNFHTQTDQKISTHKIFHTQTDRPTNIWPYRSSMPELKKVITHKHTHTPLYVNSFNVS